MQKVYLLLRDNQQSGPYTFEELLALHLKNLDLVWVEGKSHGWRYPTEIEALKPHVALAPGSGTVENPRVAEPHPTETTIPRPATNTSNKVFVSMPFSSTRQNIASQKIDPIEQKAEELRKRAEAYAPSQDTLRTNYARDLDHAEEEYTQWVYQKKTKKKSLFNKKPALITAAAIVILAAGWWASGKFFQSSSLPLPAVGKVQQSVPQIITEEDSVIQANSSGNIEAIVPAAIELKQEIERKRPEVKKAAAELKPATSVTQPVMEENKPVVNDEEKIIIAAPSPEEQDVAAPAQKKKTLKEKINGLFKNKTPEPTPSKSESNTTSSNPGERTATRRSDEKEVVTTDVSEQVEIKTNKIADSWMMGVKNLKLTLVNRSVLTVTAAKVEVLYYSDQNSLLEKKTISFSNIPPGKNQTVAVPDHRLADHIEHKVVFANGVDNAYASH